MSARHRQSSRRARGFTLVEALVALLVLSIGLLGVAALQLSSLRANHSSSLRSQATLLAYDIVDRMRANQSAANNGAYDIALATAPAGGTVALDDLVRWKQNLSNTLPAGNGAVARTGAGSATKFTVTVQWDDSRGAEAPLSFVMETQI
jgi:type IV pilus assembly protein PilV